MICRFFLLLLLSLSLRCNTRSEVSRRCTSLLLFSSPFLSVFCISHPARYLYNFLGISEYLQWSAFSKLSTVKCIFEGMLCTDKSLCVHSAQVLEKEERGFSMYTGGGGGRTHCLLHLINYIFSFSSKCPHVGPQCNSQNLFKKKKMQFEVQRHRKETHR